MSAFSGGAAAIGAFTALGKQLYDLTGRELDLGLMGLAEFAPAAVLVFVTGMVADRRDRRRVAAIAVLCEALVLVALALFTRSSSQAVWPIFLLIVLFGTARAFAGPSSRSLPADLMPASKLPWLVPRMSGMWQLAFIIGPVTAGFIYAAADWVVYLVMAGLLVVSAVALSLLPAPVRAVRDDTALTIRERAREAVEGLRFVRRQQVVFGAIALDLFAVLFGGAVALLPAIATDRLGTDAVGLGWLRAAIGVGAGLTTVVLAVRPVRRRVGRVLLVSVALFGAFTIVLGLTQSFVVAWISLALLSGADAVSVFIRATLVPLATPQDMRGRVMAVETVFIGASNEMGAFESGVAGQLIGVSGAVVLGGMATIAIAGWFWVRLPILRDVDQFHEVVTGRGDHDPQRGARGSPDPAPG